MKICTFLRNLLNTDKQAIQIHGTENEKYRIQKNLYVRKNYTGEPIKVTQKDQPRRAEENSK